MKILIGAEHKAFDFNKSDFYLALRYHCQSYYYHYTTATIVPSICRPFLLIPPHALLVEYCSQLSNKLTTPHQHHFSPKPSYVK